MLQGKESFTDTFIDDILIFSDTKMSYLAHIKCTLTALQEAKLTTKPSKCNFGFQQLKFLAHVIGNGEVKPTQDKVRAIEEMPVPTTKRNVRSLIGFMNFYVRFIQRFAEIATPLTDLTNKRAPNKSIEPKSTSSLLKI